MKLVYQRQRGDCVVAAVATLAGLGWPEVKQAAGSTRHGLDRTETRRLLDRYGCPHVYSTPRWSVGPQEWASTHPKDRALLIVRPYTGGWDHAVVAYVGQLHDPTKGVVPYASRVIEVYRLKR